MQYLYLTAVIFGVSFQNIIKKPYTLKTGGRGSYTFGVLLSVSALLFFIITSKGLDFNTGLILYSALFAVSYIMGTVFALEAISCGSLSLTALLISYSLLLPTVYGLVFLKDPIGAQFVPSFILLVISLFLTNAKSEKVKINFKWIVFATLASVGNGMCSVSQKMQQVRFEGAYKNEFMILALSIVAAFLLVYSLIKERRQMTSFIKAGWKEAILCGIANGVVNLLVMVLSDTMPASLLFPLKSGGGILITHLVARFYYKEKLSKMQNVGFIIGLASVILLNL